MTKKISQSFAQTTTAILSAIAASSFLGLPVLAQTNTHSGSSSVRCVPSSAHSNRSPVSSSASGNTSRTSANDSKPSNVQEYPNQSDPRAGVNPSSSTTGTPSSSGDVTEGTTSNQSNQNSTQSNAQMTGKCPPGMVPSSQAVPTGKNQSQNQNAVPDRNSVPREQTAPDANRAPGK